MKVDSYRRTCFSLKISGERCWIIGGKLLDSILVGYRIYLFIIIITTNQNSTS